MGGSIPRAVPAHPPSAPSANGVKRTIQQAAGRAFDPQKAGGPPPAKRVRPEALNPAPAAPATPAGQPPRPVAAAAGPATAGSWLAAALQRDRISLEIGWEVPSPSGGAPSAANRGPAGGASSMSAGAGYAQIPGGGILAAGVGDLLVLEAKNSPRGGTDLAFFRGSTRAWADSIPGRVVLLAGTARFLAVALESGALLIYSRAGRRLVGSILLGGAPAFMSAHGEWRLLVAASDGSVALWDWEQQSTVIEASVQPLLQGSPPGTQGRLNVPG